MRGKKTKSNVLGEENDYNIDIVTIADELKTNFSFRPLLQSKKFVNYYSFPKYHLTLSHRFYSHQNLSLLRSRELRNG